MSSDDAPIIINEEALTEAFVPTRLLHREGQVRELESRLKPALKNRSIENIFLMGPSGTGKTTITKWILENYFKEISAYINCVSRLVAFMASCIFVQFSGTHMAVDAKVVTC